MKLPSLSLFTNVRYAALTQRFTALQVAPTTTTIKRANSKTLLGNQLQQNLQQQIHRWHHCGNTKSVDKYAMLPRLPFTEDFFFRQLYDNQTSTYTYILGDLNANEAIIIDPVLELAKRDAQLIKELGFTLKYVLNTHMHADHITGSGWLKQLLPGSKSVIAKASGAKADIHLKEGDKVNFGRHTIDTLSTPGHTNGCMSFVVHEQGCIFTGDTVLIRGCGRTDFQEGDAATLYRNVHDKIFTLPDNFRIYPAHDYKGNQESSVWEEKNFNLRLTKPLEQFVEIMNNLNLPYPKRIDVSLPANKECGVYDIPKDSRTKLGVFKFFCYENVLNLNLSFLPQTILNAKSCAAVAAAKYGLQRDGTDTTNITQCATTGRRRKGSSSSASLSGSLSARSAFNDTKELRSALKDREAVIQNLRIQLCLGKLPRPSGPPLDESERPAAEQKLQRLKAEAENKKIKIRNLKSALDKLDITDNIDTRIRQAELEYALGREELQMLSIVEEARELQARLEKGKAEPQSIYNVLNAGVSLSLHAVHATSGRWAAHMKPDQPGFYIEWALEGDGLYKGDRILEVNGKLITCKTKEELQKTVGNSGKCQMVVLRKKPSPIPQKQLDQEKENSMRLQHRISYLEEQVRELQTVQQRDQQIQQHQQQLTSQPNSVNSHVTSISITSPPTTPPEKPLIYQRGNYITTLVGGKPIELLGERNNNNNHNNNTIINSSNNNNVVETKAHITKTLIKENTQIDLRDRHQREPRTPLISQMPPKSLSASKISINSDSAYIQSASYRREKERQRERGYERASTATKAGLLTQRANMQARSVEHLNHYNGLERRRDSLSAPRPHEAHNMRHKHSSDLRSVKSLDFENENESTAATTTTTKTMPTLTLAPTPTTNSNPTTEARVRPTPPKKPLRLSLQRAQSLQTVELSVNTNNHNIINNNNNNNNNINNINNINAELKRPMKRTHHIMDDKLPVEVAIDVPPHLIAADGRLIENCMPLQTASLGRQRHSNNL